MKQIWAEQCLCNALNSYHFLPPRRCRSPTNTWHHARGSKNVQAGLFIDEDTIPRILLHEKKSWGLKHSSCWVWGAFCAPYWVCVSLHTAAVGVKSGEFLSHPTLRIPAGLCSADVWRAFWVTPGLYVFCLVGDFPLPFGHQQSTAPLRAFWGQLRKHGSSRGTK